MHFIRNSVAILATTIGINALCIDKLDYAAQGSQLPIAATKSVNASVLSQLYKPSSFVYSSTFGMIRRGTDPERDVSAFFTFDIPSDAKGKQCTFALYLERWAQVCPSGSVPPGTTCSGKFALFSTLSPATEGGPAPTRNIYIGELQAQTSNWATWVQPTSQPQNISCPSPGRATYALVPTGESDFIYFPFSPGAKSFATFFYF